MAVVRDEEPIAEDIDIHLTLSAALPHQLAWELDEAGGIFTTYFIEALTDMRADLNGNGRLTGAELINYVKPRTESWHAGTGMPETQVHAQLRPEERDLRAATGGDR